MTTFVVRASSTALTLPVSPIHSTDGSSAREYHMTTMRPPPPKPPPLNPVRRRPLPNSLRANATDSYFEGEEPQQRPPPRRTNPPVAAQPLQDVTRTKRYQQLSRRLVTPPASPSTAFLLCEFREGRQGQLKEGREQINYEHISITGN